MGATHSLSSRLKLRCRAGEMESLRVVVTLDTDAEQVIEACSRSGFLADARSEP